MEQLKELVLLIARALVDEPDQVKVNVIESTNSLVLELSVSKKDIGKIIGKQGRTVGAFRIILNSVGAKFRSRVILEVIE
jgi:predicted RNA-binding protein YlqC (UPF0109 family)